MTKWIPTFTGVLNTGKGACTTIRGDGYTIAAAPTGPGGQSALLGKPSGAASRIGRCYRPRLSRSAQVSPNHRRSWFLAAGCAPTGLGATIATSGGRPTPKRRVTFESWCEAPLLAR